MRLLVLLLFPVIAGGPALAAERPKVRNVLFIVSDDLKASVLGCYGNELCKTPNLDRLAARGTVFERAYCQGLVCGPSRQSFMFSRYVGSPGKGPSMAEHFKDNGSYTARVGKIYHMRVPGDIIAGTNGRDHAASWTERFNAPGREAHTPGRYALLNKNVFTREEANRQSTGDPHRMFVTVESDGDGTDQPDHRAAAKATWWRGQERRRSGWPAGAAVDEISVRRCRERVAARERHVPEGRRSPPSGAIGFARLTPPPLHFLIPALPEEREHSRVISGGGVFATSSCRRCRGGG